MGEHLRCKQGVIGSTPIGLHQATPASPSPAGLFAFQGSEIMAAKLIERQYQSGEWECEKVESRWHYFLLNGAVLPVAFYEDDMRIGEDGVLTLRADAVQWLSLDYILAGAGRGGN